VRAVVVGPFRALHAGALAAAGAIALAILAIRRARAGATGAHPSRMTIALAAWWLAGAAMVGVSAYQPRRFFLFALPCIAGVALAAVSRALGPRLATPAAAAVVILQLASEVTPMTEWLGQPDPTGHARIARAIAARVTAGGGTPVLLGSVSSSVALYDRRIRPLEIGFLEVTGVTLCERIEVHHPRFAILDGRDGVDARALTCPGLVRGVRTIATYRRRGDEPTSALELVELEYPAASSATLSISTSPEVTR
jgi:hypothetical protein